MSQSASMASGSPRPASVVTLGGLFDGFEAYRTPTEEDYRTLLGDGLIVLDTNVLLNLYRYNDQTRKDLLSLLRELGDRLWVPHQVMREFWQNREMVLRDPRATSATIQELTEQRDRGTRILQAWSNRVGLPEERRGSLITILSEAFSTVIAGVEELVDDEAIEFARDTNKDAVLGGLGEILQGRVGPPLSAEEYRDALLEAKRRGEARRPPGYMDSAKDEEKAAGDYLVWVQILLEAERRAKDVLLITGDVKEDWWRREQGELRGPRRELLDELRAFAGSMLYMLRPDRFMLRARSILRVQVRDESLEDVERVDSSLLEVENGGWTVEALRSLIDRLNAEGADVQAAIIMRAGESEGFVDRQTVYAIGGYEETRSLRGFTRPVNRITREFRDRGAVSELADDVLTAEYDESSASPGVAIGFQVSTNLLQLIRELDRRSMPYQVIDAKAFDREDHRPGSVSYNGMCSLHGCGDAAVVTMMCQDRAGRQVILSVCERGVAEYELRERFIIPNES